MSLRESIFEKMKEHNVDKIVVEFSGQGDSGDIDNVDFPDHVDLKVQANLEEEVTEFFNEEVSQNIPNWYDNGGGGGRLTFTLEGKTIICDSYVNYVETLDYENNF